MKHILVVNVNWLGDVVFSSVVFKALREEYPKSFISCLAVPRVREVLECISGIDEIIEFDERGRHRSLWNKFKLIRRLRSKNFDVAFLLRPSLGRSVLLYLAGIKERVGYAVKGSHRFLTKTVVGTADDTHRADYYLRVIEAVGIRPRNRKNTLTVDDRDRNYIRQLLQANNIDQDDKFIIINPGGNWNLKRWPKENFSALINALLKKFDGKLVISGADKDKALVEEILKGVDEPQKIHNMTGQTNLKQLLALMEMAWAVISADSGPLHLASSVKARVISLFGPTRPELTGPRGPGKSIILQHDVGCNRRTCYFLECPDNICMQAISVEEVIRGIRQFQN